MDKISLKVRKQNRPKLIKLLDDNKIKYFYSLSGGIIVDTKQSTIDLVRRYFAPSQISISKF